MTTAREAAVNRPPAPPFVRVLGRVSPSDMVRVCCWCDPAGAEGLAERHDGGVLFGMCGDCLGDRVRALHGEDVTAPTPAPSVLRVAR